MVCAGYDFSVCVKPESAFGGLRVLSKINENSKVKVTCIITESYVT
jgi:hypothetical protein